MRGLSLAVMVAFGLIWLAAVALDMALPLLLAGLPGVAGPAAQAALTWATTQTGSAMALAAVSYLCAVARAPGWAALGLIAILPLLTLAVVQFDPRITAAAQAAIGPAFNDLRAAQPQIRLGLFLGLAMIAGAQILAQAGGRRRAASAVTFAVLAAWAIVVLAQDPAGMAAMALPGAVLTLMAALVLAQHDSPAAPYVLTGLACLFAGTALILAGASPRQDLRPGFAALIVMAALTQRLQPHLPAAALWVHAILIAAGLAYLAPGLQQLGDIRPPRTFADIAAAVRQAEALRTGISFLLGLWLVLGVALLWRRRHRPAPTPG